MLARIASLSLALTVTVAAAASAQQPAATGVPAYRGVIGFNPLGIPFNVLSAEVEGAVQQAFTVGGLVSYTDLGSRSERFTTVEVKGRYYPDEIALSGLSFGLSLGILSFSNDTTRDMSPRPPQPERVSHTSPTIGILADYNYLLGAQRRFFVGIGAGAKRVLSTGDVPHLGMPRAYVTGRFLVGLAF